MSYPKVKSALAMDDHTLIVEFDNFRQKKYDVSPLLDMAMFEPLKNLSLSQLKSSKVVMPYLGIVRLILVNMSFGVAGNHFFSF